MEVAGPHIGHLGSQCGDEWIEAERLNLVAMVRYAAEDGWPNVPNRLSTTLWAYLLNHSHHDDALALHTQALQASSHGEDRIAECRALINLGTVYERLRRYPEALDDLTRGLALSQEIGDRAEEGRALSNLGIVLWLMGDYAGAVDHLETALMQSRKVGDQNMESYALFKLGFVYRSLGRYDDAVSHLQDALKMTRYIGDRIDEAFALCDLGATSTTSSTTRSTRAIPKRSRRIWWKPCTAASGRCPRVLRHAVGIVTRGTQEESNAFGEYLTRVSEEQTRGYVEEDLAHRAR